MVNNDNSDFGADKTKHASNPTLRTRGDLESSTSRSCVRNWQYLYKILQNKATYDSFIDKMDRTTKGNKFASFSEIFAKRSIKTSPS